jgi:hypothetical protein
LLEAMNFVALAAVLATLGMYGMARYVRSAKTAEAVGSVSKIAEAAAAYYDGSDSLQPAGTTQAPPARCAISPRPRRAASQPIR